MKESDGTGQVRRSSGNAGGPSLQVVCLGSGGGPAEDNVTGFLVRSTAANWAKNSVLAVDAGSHLAAITRILEKDFPLISGPQEDRPSSKAGIEGHSEHIHQDSPSPGTINPSQSDDGSSSVSTPPSEEPEPTFTTLEAGAFAGLPFPHASARANALHVVREHVSTYLITHPHLDHVSGFVVNTAAFHNTSRPKRLAALPFTVNAIKTHLFNNIIWPNLTDEDGGVGLVTFQRLAEGGNIALGEGSGRGYIEVCDGLGVRGFKVSHGHCMRGPGHVHRGSNANFPETPMARRSSIHPFPDGVATATVDGDGRSLSFSMPVQSAPGTPLFTGLPDPGRQASIPSGGSGAAAASGNPYQLEQCVIDSTAYFIRTESTPQTACKEILIFGDVEPDSISLSPRTALVWAEAAPKIAANILTGIFIECSYTNAQSDAVLYGHLSPRHLLAELASLADMVKEARREHEKEKEEARKGRKRKRASLLGPAGEAAADEARARKSSRTRGRNPSKINSDDEIMPDYVGSPKPNQPNLTVIGQTGHKPSAPAALNLASASTEHSRALLSVANDTAPLKGLKVVIIHVKDTLVDGPHVGESILRELREGEREMASLGKGLGCVFEVSRSGDSYWF